MIWRSRGATSGRRDRSAGCGCRRCRPGSAVRSRRQLADRHGIAIAWGVGIGPVRLAHRRARPRRSVGDPGLAAADRATHQAIYPGIDLTQPSGVLQLTFFGFGVVHRRAGRRLVPRGLGERRGRRRLELVLSTPIAGRAGRSGARLGVLAAIAVMAARARGPHRARRRAQGGEVVAPGRRLAVLGPRRGGVRGRRAGGRRARPGVARGAR